MMKKQSSETDQLEVSNITIRTVLPFYEKLGFVFCSGENHFF